MGDDLVLPIPNLSLAQDYFVLSSPSLAHLHEDTRKSLLEGIQADRECSLPIQIASMPLYASYRHGTVLPHRYLDLGLATRSVPT